MISSEILGPQLGARTKQTAGVTVMSGHNIIDGCVGGPICNASPGGIYGPTLGADAVTTTEMSPVVTGLLFAGLAVGIFGIIKLYGSSR
jgi:hypothetical protein